MGEISFQEQFDRIFADGNASLDQLLDGLVQLFERIDPSLLEAAAALTDADIEQAFLEFAEPGRSLSLSVSREARFLTALLGAAEFKRRADRTGVPALDYARLLRVRRQLGDG